MARYLPRSCPKCGDYLGVVIPERSPPEEKILIDATCLCCGYELPSENIVLNRSRNNNHARSIRRASDTASDE